ncbi:Ca2+/Na+ antiporter [Paenarthrobacter histidinolovorans]|uniref:Ca2+/Na+ antiporter n=1 Tax=Paenarthrobacter histidinolovorans TaxID=43664 RepID=A0ABW8N9A5_9MICC
MSKVPHPFQVVAFFLMAVNFALGQPAVWWRVGAVVLMLGFGCYGVYVLRRSKRMETAQVPSELE